jgi:hypothetical protein
MRQNESWPTATGGGSVAGGAGGAESTGAWGTEGAAGVAAGAADASGLRDEPQPQMQRTVTVSTAAATD